jgi:hypothetical protein
VRKLLRDGIAFGFDKVLRDQHLFSTSNSSEEEELFHALLALVELAAMLLDMRAAGCVSSQAPQQLQQQQPLKAQHSPAASQLAELDGELLQLVGLLVSLFSRETPLHDYHQTSDLPLDGDPGQWQCKWAEPIIAAEMGPRGGWARGGGGGGGGARGGMSDGDEDEDGLFEESDREHEWLVHLINHFGYQGGFDAIYVVRGSGRACSSRACIEQL